MFSIGVVARQTGIEIGTLRKWEARYGLMQPVRLPSGQRSYNEADVEQLKMVARRLANGERIGKIIRDLAGREATSCTVGCAESAARTNSPALVDSLAALDTYDAAGLALIFYRERQRQSMLSFVEHFAAPLATLVGERWARGDLPIRGEHLFSSLIESLLIRETGLFPATQEKPQALFTTLAGERHTLGLSMAHTIVSEAGLPCLRLAADLPASEISAAAQELGIKVVGISASTYCQPKILGAMIKQLRESLPRGIELWLGGTGINRLSSLPNGCRTFQSLRQLVNTCELMRSATTQSDPLLKSHQ